MGQDEAGQGGIVLSVRLRLPSVELASLAQGLERSNAPVDEDSADEIGRALEYMFSLLRDIRTALLCGGDLKAINEVGAVLRDWWYSLEPVIVRANRSRPAEPWFMLILAVTAKQGQDVWIRDWLDAHAALDGVARWVNHQMGKEKPDDAQEAINPVCNRPRYNDVINGLKALPSDDRFTRGDVRKAVLQDQSIGDIDLKTIDPVLDYLVGCNILEHEQSGTGRREHWYSFIDHPALMDL